MELLPFGLPDNGYDDCAATVVSSEYSGLLHKLEDCRDNDIASIESGGEKSLLARHAEYDGSRECYSGAVVRDHR